jgi:hypothetical protein
MRSIRIKAITYQRNGKLVNRPSFNRKVTPKLLRAARRNLARGRSKWAGMSQIARVRSPGSSLKIAAKNLGLKHIPKLEAR